MPIQNSTLKAHVAELLGGDPAVLTAQSIVNLAGEAFFGMHQWRFNRKGPVALGTTASTATIDLPSDFGGIISLRGALGTPIELVSPDRMAAFKAGANYPGAGFAAMLKSNDSGFTLTPSQLLLHPVPSSTASSVFQLVYTAKWTALSTDGAYAQIPTYAEPLFLDVLRAAAKGYDEDDRGSVSRLMTEVRTSALFEDTVRRDAQQQREFRTLTNGIGQRYEGGLLRWNQVI
jgi:hypothetical protein